MAEDVWRFSNVTGHVVFLSEGSVLLLLAELIRRLFVMQMIGWVIVLWDQKVWTLIFADHGTGLRDTLCVSFCLTSCIVLYLDKAHIILVAVDIYIHLGIPKFLKSILSLPRHAVPCRHVFYFMQGFEVNIFINQTAFKLQKLQNRFCFLLIIICTQRQKLLSNEALYLLHRGQNKQVFIPAKF